MKFQKFLLLLIFYTSTFSYSYSIEPDVFVQSTVNRASNILSKNISSRVFIQSAAFILDTTPYNLGSSFVFWCLRDLPCFKSCQSVDFGSPNNCYCRDYYNYNNLNGWISLYIKSLNYNNVNQSGQIFGSYTLMVDMCRGPEIQVLSLIF